MSAWFARVQLEEPAMLNDGNRWFAASLVYVLDRDEPRESVTIEEDLILISAADPEHAYQKALEMGRACEAACKAYALGTEEAFRDAKMDHLVPFFFRPVLSGGESVIDCIKGPAREVTKHFAGLHDLLPLDNGLSDRAEITREKFRRDITCPSQAELEAFDPAGPAYSGDSRKQENERLWQTMHWYLAEQKFVDGRDKQSSAADVLHRFVLIHADDPVSAHEKAIADAEAFLAEQPDSTGLSSPRFAGLAELTLIYDLLEDGAELLWSEDELPREEVASYLRCKSELAAFRESNPRCGDRTRRA
jgi:hypothetical protein